VQRLADMAGGVGPISMLVEERAARGKIKQRDANQHRQRAAHSSRSENSSLRIHLATLYLSTFDVRKPRLVAINVLKVTQKIHHRSPILSLFKLTEPTNYFK